MKRRIALAQITGVAGEVESNRYKSENAIRGAIAENANIIILPELIVSGYTTQETHLALASESVLGPTYQAWHKLARQNGIHIAGGICEVDAGRLYNTAILVGPEGLCLHYRKLHLFDREQAVFTPGNLGLPLVNTEIGCIGLCICYDLRFVEVVRALALRGAQIVAVPTAWVGGFDTSRIQKPSLIGQAQGVIAQANLNQTFIACASQVGIANGFKFLGSSLIASPFGEIAAGPMDDHHESVVFADVDLDDVQSAQLRSETIRPRLDRRTDVYGLRIGKETF